MDEYIKRQDEIDGLMEMVNDHSSGRFGGALLHYTSIKAMLECLEPADVWTVVRGRWIYHPEAAWKYECSECECYAPSEWNYCPNCGSYNGGDISVDE